MFFTKHTADVKPMSKSQLDKMLERLEKEIFSNHHNKNNNPQKTIKTAA